MTTIAPNKCKPDPLKMPTKASPAPPPPRNQTPSDKLKIYHCNEWCNEYTEFYMKDAADKVISKLKETHRKEVARLLMKIAGLEKLVEAANKIIKPNGGFTIKDVKLGGVKLEGINKETRG